MRRWARLFFCCWASRLARRFLLELAEVAFPEGVELVCCRPRCLLVLSLLGAGSQPRLQPRRVNVAVGALAIREEPARPAVEGLDTDCDELEARVCRHGELLVLVVGGGHPEGAAAAIDERLRGEVQDVLQDEGEAVGLLGGDEAWVSGG